MYPDPAAETKTLYRQDTVMRYRRELEIALGAARDAGNVQLSSRQQIGAATIKADDSPVTAVDLRCEALIREQLLNEFPADGFLGEESGAIAGSSGRRWIVDPLDGTRPYLRDIPTYSVLIALEDEGQPVVGVICLPAMQQTYWAARGQGAFLNGQPLRVSTTDRLEAAMASGFGFVQEAGSPRGQALLKLMGRWNYAYGFMDAFTYGCVAAGRLDACVNLLDKPWDCAAGACIVTEAGGRYSDLQGRPSVHNGGIIISNGILHDELLKWLDRS
jgi:histidinol phosphatase-like enzyme (inositol monophosphatase family)